MKNTVKFIIATVAIVVVFIACKKEGDLPLYKIGNATVLSTTNTDITLTPAVLNNSVLTVSWTWPNYATDSANQKFVIEIDSTGHKFVKPVRKIVQGVLSTSFTGAELNEILFGFGAAKSTPFSLEIRVLSSYANNNEQYASNTITSKVTPYIIPITLAMDPPGPLTLAISEATNTAVTFNWNASIFGNQPLKYAVQIQKAGDTWTNPQVKPFDAELTGILTVSDLNSYAIIAGIAVNTTGDLDFRVVAYQGTDIANGLISTNVTTLNVTTYLPFLFMYVPGDYQGWAPATAPMVGATTPNLNAYEGYVNVPAGGTYQFKFTSAPDWNHVNYGAGSTAGTLITINTAGNLAWPSADGYYRVKCDPVALTWSATKTTWAIVGSLTGWGSSPDIPLVYDVANKIWVNNSVAIPADADWKFRANSDWPINLGGDPSGLSYDGANIHTTVAGNYKVVLDLSSPLRYKATITLL